MPDTRGHEWRNGLDGVTDCQISCPPRPRKWQKKARNNQKSGRSRPGTATGGLIEIVAITVYHHFHWLYYLACDNLSIQY